MIRIALGLAAAALAAGPLPAAAALETAPDFEERILAIGFVQPTALAWLPDGRLLVAEKHGVVKLVDRTSAPLPRTILDISRRVSNYGDQGLLGLEVDRDFGRNGFLYLAYTFDPDRSTPGGPKTARLSRFRLSPEGAIVGGARGEKVLIGRVSRSPCPPPRNTVDCIPTDDTSHTVGAVRAAADGSLWLGVGDGAPFARPNRLALRSLDERSYAGKLLHVDRRGRGLPDHPFCRSERDLRRVCTKVFAKGFRNPFRFSLAPDGRPVVGDVGWQSREEIDLVRPGGNYGWPCYEGRIRTPGYGVFGACRRLYAREGAAGGAEPPALDYPHRGMGGTVVAGPLYPATSPVTAFRDAFFFGDYVTGHLFRLPGGPGAPQDAAELLATEWAGVDLRPGPGDALTYPNIRHGFVGGIFHAPHNKSPTTSIEATPAWGEVPLRVTLRAAGAADPDGDELSYSWRLGDGTAATGAVVRHTYRRPGTYVARLTVTDTQGASALMALRIFAGNRPPVARIVEPAASRRFVAGRPIRLRAAGRDPEEGRLRGRSLAWRIVLRHGDHDHYVALRRGGRFTFKPQRDHDADSSYTISVAATDDAGLSQQRRPHTIRLRPKTTKITLASVPRGAPIAYGGRRVLAPARLRTAVGYRPAVTASPSFERNGTVYRFARWTDSAGSRRGARKRQRVVTIHPRARRLTAVYRARR